MKKKWIFIVICSFIAMSCSVQQDISITLNGSGSSDLDVELRPIFVYYILDLAEAFSDSEEVEDVDIFEIEDIRKQINTKQGASVTKITSPDQRSLHVSFKFSDIQKLLESKDNDARDIITFSSKKGINKIKFHLEKSNYEKLTELFPVLKNPVFETLAPQLDEDIPAAEYLDIIEFAMGEDGPDAVMSSEIFIKVDVKGKIISQKGGTMKNGMVLFQIPLLRICLLNKPLDFEIVYSE